MSNRERMRVAVLFGGRSGEHEVSLMSAQFVLSILQAEKYEVSQIGITKDGDWLMGEDVLGLFLKGKYDTLNPVTMLPIPMKRGIYSVGTDDKPGIFQLLSEMDVVFPVLHGTFGEDGTLQGLFEMADVAYIGAGVLASAVAMDKGVFRDVMVARGIPVLPTDVISRKLILDAPGDVVERAEALFSYPMYVKPANLGSSVGVNKCNNGSDLLEGLMDAAAYDRRVIIQQGIDAREIEISVMGNEEPVVSIPGEVLPGEEYYSYRAKYHNERSKTVIPADLSQESIKKIQDIAKEAYKAIDCAGLARVDFLLDATTGDLYLNEMNTIPGFTQISMYPKLWEASGVSNEVLIERLIEYAFERKADRENMKRDYSSVL